MASSSKQLRSILADLAALSGILRITRVDPVTRDDIPKAFDLSEGGWWSLIPDALCLFTFPSGCWTQVLYVLFMFRIPL